MRAEETTTTPTAVLASLSKQLHCMFKFIYTATKQQPTHAHSFEQAILVYHATTIQCNTIQDDDDDDDDDCTL